MEELSEASELSQRAVYADVRYNAQYEYFRLIISRFLALSTP